MLATSPHASAQDPPPRIGPFVIDAHGTIPNFPSDPHLTDSRSLSAADLPGVGLGLHAGAHVYVLRWKAVTFGLGGELTMARAHSSRLESGDQVVRLGVTERLVHLAPQLSLNFGDGNGWSYISGGIGPTKWSIVPDGQPSAPPDEERQRTINYGAGARWFAKRHVAFSFDVRFYDIDPGTVGVVAGSPRTTMFIAGAGVSLK